jgi:hypothetical protein
LPSHTTPLIKKNCNGINDICVGVNVGTQRLTRSLKGTTILMDLSFTGHKKCGTVFHNFEDTQTVTDEIGNVTSKKCLTYQTQVTGISFPRSATWYDRVGWKVLMQ